MPGEGGRGHGSSGRWRRGGARSAAVDAGGVVVVVVVVDGRRSVVVVRRRVLQRGEVRAPRSSREPLAAPSRDAIAGRASRQSVDAEVGCGSRRSGPSRARRRARPCRQHDLVAVEADVVRPARRTSRRAPIASPTMRTSGTSNERARRARAGAQRVCGARVGAGAGTSGADAAARGVTDGSSTSSASGSGGAVVVDLEHVEHDDRDVVLAAGRRWRRRRAARRARCGSGSPRSDALDVAVAHHRR